MIWYIYKTCAVPSLRDASDEWAAYKHNLNKNAFRYDNIDSIYTRIINNGFEKSYFIVASDSCKEILKLHGIGKSSIPKLKTALAKQKMNFRIDA